MKTFIVKSNGNQAPYGIGEIMETFRSLKSAIKYASKWHNMPKIYVDGVEIDFERV